MTRILSPLWPPKPLKDGLREGDRLGAASAPADPSSSVVRTLPLSPIAGHALFTLGLIYHGAGVDRDLLVEYGQGKFPGGLVTACAPTPVLPQISGWERMFYILPDEVFVSLSGYLRHLALADRREFRYYQIHKAEFSWGQPGLAPRSLVVFYLRGNRPTLRPVSFNATLGVTLIREPPASELVTLAEEFFRVSA